MSRVSIVGQYQSPIQHRFNDEDVVPTHGGHSRSRHRSRETKPVGRKPKVPHRSSEHMHSGAASAECPMRAARRMLHDGFGDVRDSAVRMPSVMVPMRMVFVMMSSFSGG